MTLPGNVYDKFGSTNLLVKRLMETYTETLISILSEINYKNMLEVGCGEGYLMQLIKKQNLAVKPVLSDISHPIMLTTRILHPETALVTASVTDLPFRDNQYDLICAAEVLEHVPDPVEALKELGRVGRKYVLFSVPREPIWRILNIIRLSYLKSWGNTPGHMQHWTAREFKNLLEPYFEILLFRTPFPWSMVLCQVKTRQE